MTLTSKNIIALAIASIVFVSALAYGLSLQRVSASAPSGLQSTVATSSNPTVTSTASLVFATSSQCASRVVSTQGSAIMITFSDNQGKVPTGTFGHVQPASTTVAYDGGLYGCNAVRIFSYASQAITVTETR